MSEQGTPSKSETAPPRPAPPPAAKPAGELDPFHLEKLFPDPVALLEYVPPSISEIKDTAIFVLDANTLLRPFEFDQSGFKDIETILRNLAKDDRIFVPAQSVREYARNRGRVMSGVIKRLPNYSAGPPKELTAITLPVFDNLKEYRDAVRALKPVVEAWNSYAKKVDELRAVASGWHWNDQVSTLYKELLPPRIINHQLKPKDVLAQLEYRYRHKQPPGFMDSTSKPDKGIGDLLIWFSILDLGQSKQRDVIFVSDDEKIDWKEQADGFKTVARFELVTEFYQACKHHFASITFAEFLKVSGAKEKTVSEAASASSRKSIASVYLLESITLTVSVLREPVRLIIDRLEKPEPIEHLRAEPYVAQFQSCADYIQNTVTLGTKSAVGNLAAADLAILGERISEAQAIINSTAPEIIFADAWRIHVIEIFTSLQTMCDEWIRRYGGKTR